MDRLGPEVERELRRFGPAAGMAKLVAAWPEAVGPAIARSAWPARFARDGTVVVHTSDAVWAFELAQRVDEIAGRLGDLVPGGISFAPGPIPEQATPAPRAERPATPLAGPKEAALAAGWAAAIEDLELRELVARAARASLARAAAKPSSGRRF